MIALLLLAQVGTSTPALETRMERALWRQLSVERLQHKAEVRGLEDKLAARQTRIDRLETLTSSLAAARLPLIPVAGEAPLMSPTGALVCGGVALGVGVLGAFLGRQSCGPIVIPLGSSP